MKVSQEEAEMHESKREAKGGGEGGKGVASMVCFGNAATPQLRDLFCSVFGSCL